MTPASPTSWPRSRISRSRAVRVAICVALLVAMSGVASAYWSAVSAPGGNGAAVEASVNQGATPAASVSGTAVTVTWSPTTLSNGRAVDGYVVNRYDVATLTAQTITSACGGTITATSCTESAVPTGQWVYSVTPVFATSWRGAESAKSATVTVSASTLVLSPGTVRPGTSLTGTAAGFPVAEILRYRLDSPTGTELVGSLAGVPTPTVVPPGGGGAVVVTVPAGTADGPHTIYAVTSPSGATAAAVVVVDGTAPPLPVLTLTPTAVSGDSATFAFTESETTATLECSLDAAAYGPCTSPADYTLLAAGSHTFAVRATDTLGNVSAATTYTWTVNLSVPTVIIAFPTIAGLYNDSGFTAACATAAVGDVCGTADDDVAVTAVKVSLRRLSTGLYWDGTAFAAASETFLTATGTIDWSYPIAAAAFTEGDYTLRAQASDGANLGYDVRTFTIDRTAPALPTLTSVPPPTSGPMVTFAFTDTDVSAGFECRLDSGAWMSCSSPQTYVGLTDGTHTVAIRAVDGAGNTSAATSTTWTIDATAPTVATTFPTATSYNLAGWTSGCGTPATDDVCGTSTDAGSGVAAVTVSIRRASTGAYWDGTGFTAGSETWLTATGITAWSYAFAGTAFPADGGYVVRYRSADAVGNSTTSSVSLVIDTAAPPVPVIVQAPTDPSGGSAQFDFTESEAGAATQCRLDAGAWSSCTGPLTYTALSAGSHTFAVRAGDVAGNLSAAASYTWTVNTGLPSVAFGFPSSGRSYHDATFTAGCGTPAGDVCGTASDPQGALAAVAVSVRNDGIALYWNGVSFASVSEVFLAATGTTSWSYAIAATSLPTEGSYTFRARATNTVALTAFDTLTITVDRTAPTAPTITSGPTGTTAGGDTFAFTGEAGASFQCRLDAGVWATCASPKTNGVLADGSHTFDVRAVDGAGNTGASTSRTWTVDTTAPAIGTTFPVPGGRYTDAGYNAGCGTSTIGDVCGTTSDAASGVATVEISVQRASTGLYLTGTTFSAASPTWGAATGTTAWSYAIAATTFPADGTYTLSVRATDAVGNASTSSTAFVIDRTKPTAVGITTTNISTLRKLEQGDSYTLIYSEPVAPGSIIAGWNGLTTQNVVVRVTNSTTADKLVIYNSTNTATLPLGSVNLKRADFVTASGITFGKTGTPCTLTMSGSSVTITLGTVGGSPGVAAAAANMTWTPNSLVTDLAGNTASTTGYTEVDNDSDF